MNGLLKMMQNKGNNNTLALIVYMELFEKHSNCVGWICREKCCLEYVRSISETRKEKGIINN